MLINNCLVELLQGDSRGALYPKRVKIVMPTNKILITLKQAFARVSLTGETHNDWFAFEYYRRYNQITAVWYRMRGFGIETAAESFCNYTEIGIIEIPKITVEALMHPHPYIRYRARLTDDPTKVQ